MRQACVKPRCCHNGVVSIPVGHGRTASRVYLCEPHFEEWLAALRVRRRWPCAVDGCPDVEHMDGLCERHWVTLRGADPPGTPAESSAIQRFHVRHRRSVLAQVADAPDEADVEAAEQQAPSAAYVARLVSRLARSAPREVVEDAAEAARLLREVAGRLALLRGVKPRARTNSTAPPTSSAASSTPTPPTTSTSVSTPTPAEPPTARKARPGRTSRAQLTSAQAVQGSLFGALPTLPTVTVNR